MEKRSVNEIAEQIVSVQKFGNDALKRFKTMQLCYIYRCHDVAFEQITEMEDVLNDHAVVLEKLLAEYLEVAGL